MRLGGEDAGQRLARGGLGLRGGRDPLELFRERHLARIVPMAQAASPRTRAARELFAPLGPTYDRYARLLSFGQDPRWRRFLVERIEARPGDVVVDVATGTGAVALELVRQKGCSVVGIDQSAEMLEEARRRIALAAASKDVRLVEGRAEELPFEEEPSTR